MEQIVTTDEMRRMEQEIMQQAQIGTEVLMERAASAAARVIRKYSRRHCIPKHARILIVCGMGNNGADGLALARILAEDGYAVTVCLVGNRQKRSEMNVRQEQTLRFLLASYALDVTIGTLTDTKENGCEYAVIVDAILGIGINRPLSGEIAQAVEWMNRLCGFHLALDIPTGVDADTGNLPGSGFLADVTVTFGAKKAGLLLGDGKRHAGKIRKDTCGIVYPKPDFPVGKRENPFLFCLGKKDVTRFLKRDPQGNKGSFGKIGMIAGNEDMAGAALLSVGAAFSCGAGYIRLLTHEKNRTPVMQKWPETVLLLYREDVDHQVFGQLAGRSDVLVAGPGIGTGNMAYRLLAGLFSYLLENGCTDKKLLLDADALNLLAEHEQLQQQFDRLTAAGVFCVITPHLLEFSRLSKKALVDVKQDKIRCAVSFAKQHGCTVVLKDAQTVIAHPSGRVCIGIRGNDGMAVAGSGDVLTGILAACLGHAGDARTDTENGDKQDLQSFLAVCCGVFVQGFCGDAVKKKCGAHSMLPQDQILSLRKCMKKLGKEAEEKNETV